MDLIGFNRRERVGGAEWLGPDALNLFNQEAGFLDIRREIALPCKTQQVFLAAGPGRFDCIQAAMQATLFEG